MELKALKNHSQYQKDQKLLEEQSKKTGFLKKKHKTSTKVVDV